MRNIVSDLQEVSRLAISGPKINPRSKCKLANFTSSRYYQAIEFTCSWIYSVTFFLTFFDYSLPLKERNWSFGAFLSVENRSLFQRGLMKSRANRKSQMVSTLLNGGKSSRSTNVAFSLKQFFPKENDSTEAVFFDISVALNCQRYCSLQTTTKHSEYQNMHQLW